MATFDERAGDWDKTDRINMASAIAKKMIAELKPEKTTEAADIGAGTGLVSIEISKTAKSIVAMDSSPGMLSVLGEKIAAGNIQNVTTMLFDADTDEVPAGSFDMVVSTMAMHHVKDTAAFARRIFDMLRHGGKFGIADLEKEDGSFHGANPDGVIHNGFDRDTLEGEFRNAGFHGIRFTTAYTANRGNASFSVFLMTGEKQ